MVCCTQYCPKQIQQQRRLPPSAMSRGNAEEMEMRMEGSLALCSLRFSHGGQQPPLATTSLCSSVVEAVRPLLQATIFRASSWRSPRPMLSPHRSPAVRSTSTGWLPPATVNASSKHNQPMRRVQRFCHAHRGAPPLCNMATLPMLALSKKGLCARDLVARAVEA